QSGWRSAPGLHRMPALLLLMSPVQTWLRRSIGALSPPTPVLPQYTRPDEGRGGALEEVRSYKRRLERRFQRRCRISQFELFERIKSSRRSGRRLELCGKPREMFVVAASSRMILLHSGLRVSADIASACSARSPVALFQMSLIVGFALASEISLLNFRMAGSAVSASHCFKCGSHQYCNVTNFTCDRWHGVASLACHAQCRSDQSSGPAISASSNAWPTTLRRVLCLCDFHLRRQAFGQLCQLIISVGDLQKSSIRIRIGLSGSACPRFLRQALPNLFIRYELLPLIASLAQSRRLVVIRPPSSPTRQSLASRSRLSCRASGTI